MFKFLQKLVAYYNFIIVVSVVILGLVSAASPVQLISAALFIPLAFYFILLVLPHTSKAIKLPKASPQEEPLPEPVVSETGIPVSSPPVGTPAKVFDFDRRLFLKLIGSAGISLFVYSLFTKKAEAAFFGSVPGPGTVSLKDTAGTKIDPAEKQPTDGYSITDIYDTTYPSYYGFTKKDGTWFIMQESSTGAYRYFKGSSTYSTNWTGRALLDYDYFNEIFT